MFFQHAGFLGLAALTFNAATAHAANIDVINNFCKRWQHQTALTSKTLFIDGGIEFFRDQAYYGNETVGVDTFTITTDFTSSWDWSKQNPTNITQTSIYKTRTPGRKSGYVPSLLHGALWQNSNETLLYFYGGTTNLSLSNFTLYTAPLPDTQVLWRYDIIEQFWDPVVLASGSDDITRAAYGASVVAPELNKAYYLNGWVDSGSTDTTDDLPSPRYLMGLLEFDFDTEGVRNISTSGLNNRARSGGQMVYIPNYGKKGILVVIGGQLKSSMIVDQNVSTGDLVPMSDVAVYDIGSATNNTDSGAWYVQTSTADANVFPNPRTDHCLVVVSAPDNSSHSIYMYGGRNPITGAAYDDVWVLSVPSFQWIRIYTGQSPRYGTTCHLAGRRQMLTVGGLGTGFLDTTNTSLPDGGCDWERNSVAIYDLTTLQWGKAYNANADNYTVPVEISQKIGGNATGGATVRSPLGDKWVNTALAALLDPPPSATPSPSSTSSPSSSASPSASSAPSSSAPASAIAGGVIGGLAFLALIAGFFLVRRRRQRKAELEDQPYLPSAGEMKMELSSGEQKQRPELAGTELSHEQEHEQDGPRAELGNGDEVTRHLMELP